MSGNKVNQAEVNMGLPRFQPEQIPVKVKVDIIPILDYPLVIDGKKLTVSLLSMGNPHAVSFLSRPIADFPLAEIGPKVERHPMFPQRTNFGVARVLNREKIEARVWERGVGETLTCGSGACAIAVAAQLLDYIEPQVDIILEGGTLTVSWDRVGEVLLSGPVEEVFTGEWIEERS
jgi:diaminopimelate epimerase